MPLIMRNYLDSINQSYPEGLLVLDDKVNPAAYEVTAILKQLELAREFPAVYFTNPLNLKGEVSSFPLVTNIFATRERCALALGLESEHAKLPLSLEYARREARFMPAETVPKNQAPVKDVVKSGEEVDLREFPIVRHHDMDLAPYITMIVTMRDPENGAYNAAFQRAMYKGPRKLGLQMAPTQNWEIHRRNESAGRGTPTVIVVSHHPSFSLGALNIAPFATSDYGVIGSIMNEPLRITTSETWGDDFLVPADADILIEGEVLPDVREIEAPFGEYTGYFGPQVYRWVIDVKAVSYRKDAIYQDIFVGHHENWIMGAIPKEGSIYNSIKAVVPNVKGVCLPNSGCGRFNCYISIDKHVDGESKMAALIAMGHVNFVKNAIVVDGDVDPFNEEEVMWSVATRVQADEDVDILKNVKGDVLDPSIKGDIMTTKMIVDATRPCEKPFPKRLEIPSDAMDRVKSILESRKLI
ncbi:UbiD family decarboxylase [Chloroflexota bacterium]